MFVNALWMQIGLCRSMVGFIYRINYLISLCLSKKSLVPAGIYVIVLAYSAQKDAIGECNVNDDWFAMFCDFAVRNCTFFELCIRQLNNVRCIEVCIIW